MFRWPGDRSQVWVKRVIGLPGDHIALRRGQVWIDGAPVDLRPAGVGKVEVEDGREASAERYIETLPGGYEHLIFKMLPRAEYDDMANGALCHPVICSLWATTAITPPTAVYPCAPVVSDCCQWTIWLVVWMRSLVPGISPSKADR